MKKFLFVLLCIILAVLTIYYFSVDNRIYYISLGDYLSVGVTPKHEIGKSYGNYFKELLEEKYEIKKYSNIFSNEHYRTIDLVNDIKNNAVKDNFPIQQALDKATHLTVSIGSNDIFYKMGINDMKYNLSNTNDSYFYIREVINDMKKLFEQIEKYCHGDVYIVGFYNPLSAASSIYARELEPLFLYANEELKKLCDQFQYTYVDIYTIFKENPQFLPNKTTIYPNLEGYRAIAQQIFSKIS